MLRRHVTKPYTRIAAMGKKWMRSTENMERAQLHKQLKPPHLVQGEACEAESFMILPHNFDGSYLFQCLVSV